MSCLLLQITNSRESNSKGEGGRGAGKCQVNIIIFDRFRQSNCSLKLVEKEKKIMDYKQIQFDRKQTNEIKSND